jgi:hypothetical protein
LTHGRTWNGLPCLRFPDQVDSPFNESMAE